MRRWLSGIGPFREEAVDGEPKSGAGGGEEPTTFKINGKDIPIETLSAALNLHSAMGNPEIATEIVGTLARNLGLLDKAGDVKDPKEAQTKLEGRVTKLLKSKLGKDYEKFSDAIGPVMDEAIQEYLNEHAASVESTSGEATWSGEVEHFTDTHTLTTEVETKMEEIIKRNGGIPKGLKGKAAQEYLSDMYELAVKKLGGIVQETDNDDEERPLRTRRGRRERPEFREVERPKGVLSLDQIVDAAMRGQRFR